MKIYSAAVYVNSYMKNQVRYPKFSEAEHYILDNIKHLLESYHYINKERTLNVMRENGAQLFLDSGAFSAWTKGAEINLYDYCNYVKENSDLWIKEDGITLFSVLDGIGDPLVTYQNQKRMEDLGVTPLPCFHYGEDVRYLEYYIENYDYITIGGMVGKSGRVLEHWLDYIWNKFLLDENNKPRVKVHAFGITSFRIMYRYPWHSCDSSSWIQAASFGNIITDKWGIWCISNKSDRIHNAGQHILSLPKIEREAFIEYLKNDGFDYERLSDSYECRAIYNLYSIEKINNNLLRIKNNDKKAYQKLLFEE